MFHHSVTIIPKMPFTRLGRLVHSLLQAAHGSGSPPASVISSQQMKHRGGDSAVVTFSRVNSDLIVWKHFDDGPSCPILNIPKAKTGPETRDVIHCFEDGLCLNKPFKPTEDARISDVIFCFADGMCYDDWVIKTDNL